MSTASTTPAESSGGEFAPPTPGLEYLARFHVDLTDPLWDLGRTSDLGVRRIVPITGGTFTGSRLQGEILNHGADWQIVTDRGAIIIDTRYLLRTDDDALIFLSTKGFRNASAEVMANLAAGRPVDPSSYYFRITMSFETADPRYTWLNTSIFVGSALRQPNAVVYDAYVVT
jgi:Protein of unknown function (DUF3237)